MNDQYLNTFIFLMTRKFLLNKGQQTKSNDVSEAAVNQPMI